MLFYIEREDGVPPPARIRREQRDESDVAESWFARCRPLIREKSTHNGCTREAISPTLRRRRHRRQPLHKILIQCVSALMEGPQDRRIRHELEHGASVARIDLRHE